MPPPPLFPCFNTHNHTHAPAGEYVTSFLSEVGVRVPGEDSADSSDDGGVGGAENLAGVTSRVAQRARAMEEMFFGDADEAL